MTLVLDPPRDVEERLEREATSRGLDVRDYALELLRTSTIVEPEQRVIPEKLHPAAALALELSAKVPKEAWKDVPKDLAMNYKHYLYEAPKEE